MAYVAISPGRLRCQHFQQRLASVRDENPTGQLGVIYSSEVSMAIAEVGSRERGCAGEMQECSCDLC